HVQPPPTSLLASPTRPSSNLDKGITSRSTAIFTAPATWTALLWLISAVPSLLLLAIPAGLLAHAITQTIHLLTHNDPLPHLLDLTLNALLIYLAYLLTPHALTLYLRFNRLLLAPSEKARLTARVRHLATSRANTIDTQASEIRRIERDLHDGAQARLVALGIHLGMAEQIITQDPNTARTT